MPTEPNKIYDLTPGKLPSNETPKLATSSDTVILVPEATKIGTSEAPLTAKSLATNYDNIFKEMSNDVSNTKIANILEYDWCVNYKEKNTSDKYKKLPIVFVQEYRQNLSTFAASLRWLTSGVDESLGITTGAKTVADMLKKVASKDNIEDGTSDAWKIASPSNQYNNIIENVNGLKPYRSMYSYDKTDCLSYVFPYFENDVINIKNTFGEKAQHNVFWQNSFSQVTDMIGQGTGLLDGLVGGATSLGNFESYTNDTGIYIEKPKYFQYDGSGDIITIKFTLYNTLVHEDGSANKWKQHYNFIKNFTFKNLPYKTSIFRYKTPALYEVHLPGIKYFPVAFVSNFDVKLKGTRRILEYNGTKGSSFNMTVPDAWEITIMFESLLAKSGNLFNAALLKGPTITYNGGNVN